VIPSARQPATSRTAIPWVRRRQIGLPVHPVGHEPQELVDPRDRLVGDVLGQAAGAHVRVVHPQPGRQLEDVEDVLPLPEAVDHHRQRAQLHAGRRQPDQVRGDPVEFHHQDPDRGRPVRDLLADAQQLLDRQRVPGFVEHRGQVVHPGHERAALDPVAVLEVLLDAGVQVADDRPGLDDGLALQFEDEPKHTVGRRVLRAHVDDDPFVADRVTRNPGDGVPVSAGDREDLALGGLARAGVVGTHARALRFAH
jgi:hypothetical protein